MSFARAPARREKFPFRRVPDGPVRAGIAQRFDRRSIRSVRRSSLQSGLGIPAGTRPPVPRPLRTDADGADYLALRSGHPLEPYYDRFGSVGHLFAFGARLVRRAQSVARLLPLPARFLRESGGVRGRLRGMEAARRPGYADRLGGVVPRQRKSRYAAGRLCAGQRRRSVPELAVRFLFRLPSFPDAAIAGRGACADRPDDRLQPAGRLAQCRFSVRHRPVPDRRSLFRRQIAE